MYVSLKTLLRISRMPLRVVRSRVKGHTEAHTCLPALLPRAHPEKLRNLRRTPHQVQVTHQSQASGAWPLALTSSLGPDSGLMG